MKYEYLHKNITYYFLLTFGKHFIAYRVVVIAGKRFSVSHVKPLIRFRSAANTVLNVLHKPSENILMKLLYSTCVPVMTYACDAEIYSAVQINSLNVALNDAIRHIFGYNRWESIRYLRLCMGYPSMTDICNRRRLNFLQNIPLIGNTTLQTLSELI